MARVSYMIEESRRRRRFHKDSNYFLGALFLAIGIFIILDPTSNGGAKAVGGWVIITSMTCFRDGKATYAKTDAAPSWKRNKWARLQQEQERGD